MQPTFTRALQIVLDLAQQGVTENEDNGQREILAEQRAALELIECTAPAMLAALRDICHGGGSVEGAIKRALPILARIDGTPTAQPAAPTVESDKVAMGLWRAMAAKEIAAQRAPKATAPILAGIKWAAQSVASELAGAYPGFDRAGFLAKCGYPGEG